MQDRLVTKTQLNQGCAEQMLLKAAQVVSEMDIDFNYPDAVIAAQNDVQVDITPAMNIAGEMYSEGSSHVLLSGHTASELQKDFSKILVIKSSGEFNINDIEFDRQAAYFVRTGVNGSAGHWSFLYLDKETTSWVMYSSEKNHYRLADINGKLTEEALDTLVSKGRDEKGNHSWGDANGKRSMLLVNATPTRVANAANFLFDLRCNGFEYALERLYTDINERVHTFDPQLQATFIKKKPTVTPKPITPIEPVLEPISIPSNSEEQLMREKIDNLIKTLTTETNRLKKSCFSFLFCFEINTKQQKLAALNDIILASDLTDMQNRAANYKNDSRVMRSMKTDRTRKLINDITVRERTTFKI